PRPRANLHDGLDYSINEPAIRQCLYVRRGQLLGQHTSEETRNDALVPSIEDRFVGNLSRIGSQQQGIIPILLDQVIELTAWVRVEDQCLALRRKGTHEPV